MSSVGCLIFAFDKVLLEYCLALTLVYSLILCFSDNLCLGPPKEPELCD